MLLTLSLPAAADIIYSGLLDTAIPTNFTGITVTVGDGTLNPFFGGVGVANNNFLQPGRIGTGNLDAIVNFGAGATINSGMTLDAALGYGGSSTHVGNGALQFAPGSEGYIGFKLDGANYGWMRVVFTNNTGGAVVKDWAYDNSGTALVTGNVLQSAVSGGAQTVTLTSASGSFTLGTAITDAFGNAGGVVNSVVKVGAGTTVLSAANNYTGTTTVSTGTLVSNNLTGWKSSVAIASGATFNWNVTSNQQVADTAGNYTVSGAGLLALSGGAKQDFGNNTPIIQFNLSAGGQMDVQGSGTIVEFGYAHNSMGGNLGSLNVATGASYRNSDASAVVDALTGGGVIGNAYNGSFALTVGASNTVNNAAYGVASNTATFSGVIKDVEGYNGQGTGPTSLIKVGTGTQIFSGTNTYTGVTSVNAGSLVINGDQSAATGAVTVAAGATNATAARLKGTGTVGGNTTFAADPDAAGAQVGGIHSPGNSVGTQTFDAPGASVTSLTYNSGSIFEWELASTPAETAITTDLPGAYASNRGTAYDAVNVTGTLGGTDAIFRVVLDGAQTFADAFWDTNRTWTDIFRTGDGSGTSNVNYASIFGGGFQYYNYSGGGSTLAALTTPTIDGSFSLSGSTLTWSAVPEPSSALAGLLLAAGLLRRRRSA